jgi:hypothetical protein
MVELRDKDKGTSLGRITDEQLQFLIDQLEEESLDDVDYYINRETLEVFEERGADPALLSMLKKALGSRESMEIEWSRR